MNERILASALQVESTTSMAQLSGLTGPFVQRHGFDKFALSYISDEGYEAAEIVPVTNIIPGFVAHYAQNDYYLLDPVARFCLKTKTPFIWEEELSLKERPSVVRRSCSGGAAELEAAPGEAGPIRAVNGLRGSVRFAGERSRFGAQERMELNVLALVLHARIAELLYAELAAAQPARLSEREREILRWCALGKTSDDIAMILGLTKRTVDQHFENASRKLGTVNRVQTVVKSVREHLIAL